MLTLERRILFLAAGDLLHCSFAEVTYSLLLYVALIVLPVILLAWLASFLLSLPMRRQQRARFFLDLLETALKQGRPVEQTLVEISNSRDNTLGVRFHLLAAHIENGLRLEEALKKVPRLLPPQVVAMLRAGARLGDLRKVLPACRRLLQDAQSNVRGAASYLVVIAFVLSPVAMLIYNTLAVYVFPKYYAVTAEYTAGPEGVFAPLFEWVSHSMRWFLTVQACLFTVLMLAAFIYVGGPRVICWFQLSRFAFVDWLAWRVPWKHKRMQRNFSAILSVLLDSGVPEAEAVRLAADCTANEIFRRRAARLIVALQRGVKLTEAVQALDDTGEFRWRLTNAAHAQGGFLRALAGWHESLDAKAFQQEQAAAHLVTSALVVANGTLVALVAIAVFSALISIINAICQW
jgi:type II secretory pathway component PulF